MKKVFLSASFPDPARTEESGPFHSADIAAATSAVVEATLRANANLIFGGHPTISPLVLHVAAMLNSGSQVTIYQSEYFERHLTREVRRLVESEEAQLVFTKRGPDLTTSLRILRQAMFSSLPDVGFFIGGMSGVKEEFELLSSANSQAACIAFRTPGGAASRLQEQVSRSSPDSAIVDPIMLEGRAYGSLAMRTLSKLGVGVPRQSDEF